MRKAPHGPSIPPIANKPFCDCKACTNKACPDILKLIPIPLAERARSKPNENKTPQRDSSAPLKPGTAKKKKSKVPKHPSILDLMNEERDCACEVMARAVAPHVHKNLGMDNYRCRINQGLPPTEDTNNDADTETNK